MERQLSETIKSAKGEWKRLVIEFYRIHNPLKIKDVDAILEEYEGAEAELYSSLIEKYQRKPSESSGGGIGSPPRTPPEVVLQAHTSMVSQSTAATEGLRKRMSLLRLEYPEEDEGSLGIKAVEQQRVWRNAIISFYIKHQPSKLANINEIFQECDGEEEMLYELLEAKYKGKGKVGLQTTHDGFEKRKVVCDKGTQCDAAISGVSVSATPLTNSMDITAGELVALEDVGDQLEWSLLVMLEQGERVRSILSNLPQPLPSSITAPAAEKLGVLHRESMSLRTLLSTHFAGTVTVPDVSLSFPPPPRIGVPERVASMSPPPYPYPVQVTTPTLPVAMGMQHSPPRSSAYRTASATPASISPSKLLSPPAPLPATVNVNTRALLEAVATLQSKGVTFPSASPSIAI
eukprot:TRINITY_DN14740_c0_g1_i1.p1 TRINITY_DN14740_c0_g1~~TRINITY_DN14740_c0_g1_i1.p1  ORF type:complete len:425 (+),score=70.22 TRINITY_DN14740_c0_g1_i1:64-1275(+)